MEYVTSLKILAALDHPAQLGMLSLFIHELERKFNRETNLKQVRIGLPLENSEKLRGAEENTRSELLQNLGPPLN